MRSITESFCLLPQQQHGRYHSSQHQRWLLKNVIRHNLALEQIIPIVNKISNLSSIQADQNNIVERQINSITEILNQATNIQAATAKYLPQLISGMARSEETITRYGIALDDLKQSARFGFINRGTFQFLVGPDRQVSRGSMPTLHEDRLRLIKSNVNDDTIFMQLETKILTEKHESTGVFRSHQLKEWTTDNTYRICTGPAFVLYNSTANCTRRIGVPLTDTIAQACSKANFTDIGQRQCKDVISEDELGDTRPDIVRTELVTIIQCFHNNITIGNITNLCPPYPIALTSLTPFEVAGYTYNFVHEITQFKNDEITKIAESSWSGNLFSESFVAIANLSEKFSQNNVKMDGIKNTPALKIETPKFDDWMSVLLSLTGGLGTSGIIIILIIVYIILTNRKSGIQQMVETSMMVSIADRLSKSMPNLQRAQSGSFASSTSHMYPCCHQHLRHHMCNSSQFRLNEDCLRPIHPKFPNLTLT